MGNNKHVPCQSCKNEIRTDKLASHMAKKHPEVPYTGRVIEEKQLFSCPICGLKMLK